MWTISDIFTKLEIEIFGNIKSSGKIQRNSQKRLSTKIWCLVELSFFLKYECIMHSVKIEIGSVHNIKLTTFMLETQQRVCITFPYKAFSLQDNQWLSKSNTVDIKRHMLLPWTPSDTTSKMWQIEAKRTPSYKDSLQYTGKIRTFRYSTIRNIYSPCTRSTDRTIT